MTFLSENSRSTLPRRSNLIREHNVDPLQILEVHRNQPRYFVRNRGLRTFNMIGQTFAGRWMVVSTQPIEEAVFRVVTAYWNNDGRAAKLYGGQP